VKKEEKYNRQKFRVYSSMFRVQMFNVQKEPDIE